MKKILVVSALMVTQSVLASVDYSKCQQAIGIMGGPQLTENGELSPGFGQQPNPDVKTAKMLNDEIEITYTFKGQNLGLNGKPTESKYKVRKNKEGHVIEVQTSQDKLDPAMVNMHKQWALSGAVNSGISQDSLAYDPIVMLQPGDGKQTLGTFTNLSKLTKEQGKQFGVDIDDLRALRKQVRKDKKTLAKISEGYSKLLNKSSMMLPNGVDAFMEVKDGVCRPTQIFQVTHDAKTKTNHISSSVNQVRCDEILKIQKKYSKKLEACGNTNMEMFQEMYPQGGGIGGIVGGMQGGMAGGIQGGYVQAYGQGGYPGGMGGGYGMGMGGYGYGFGGEVAQCNQYFGEMGGYVQGGMAGGYVGGAQSGSTNGSGSGRNTTQEQ
ncbi:MAG: hypothetical protein H0V66_15030 [Bdellovibrionales bacterium]|nr:hypothetical protein [Bdellovibrionales bacterium]